MSDVTIWGVHMAMHVEDRPIEGGYVDIGWPALGDARRVGATRGDYERAMVSAYADIKPGAVPVDAGTVAATGQLSVEINSVGGPERSTRRGVANRDWPPFRPRPTTF